MTKLRNVTSMITSISMVAQWSVRLSGEAVAVAVVGGAGGARVVVAGVAMSGGSFFLFCFFA